MSDKDAEIASLLNVLADTRTENMRLRVLAEAVCWFDWSDNDADAVQAIDALRAALYPPIAQEARAALNGEEGK